MPKTRTTTTTSLHDRCLSTFCWNIVEELRREREDLVFYKSSFWRNSSNSTGYMTLEKFAPSYKFMATLLKWVENIL